MKTTKIITLFLVLLLSSCGSISVYSDYDKTVDFSGYKTYAFLKSGIDKAEISELDKKRILRAIEAQMAAKGFTKSETPDMLVTFFTKTKEEVSVNQFNAGWGYGWGWGWNPWGFGNQTMVQTNTVGTLFIDLVDAKKKELIWQGEGVGHLTSDFEKKDERINEFVTQILMAYPPVLKKQ